eukprot:CAMPEP_0167740654 /NCGR_PEP_ID=MMETSP0110_2-20121227/406_1 /TAXON_ID=629695 /ORGANISM="Gymnochlora sp., Strain CCMP2014" /LENGTH=482 /DNA_ID=CAMNT_0007624589 /DNA_START=142 /DNA_END=1590 /DNA_ORIENTATION=-
MESEGESLERMIEMKRRELIEEKKEAWEVFGTEDIVALTEDQLKELDDMGWWDLREIVECLQVYSSKYGHVYVSPGFVVPSQDPWPINCWQLRLGEHLNSFREAGGRYLGPDASDAAAKLIELGFNWDIATYSWEDLWPALVAYKNVTGGLEIPINFVVPVHDSWPLSAAGMELGQIATNILRAKEEDSIISKDVSKQEAKERFGKVMELGLERFPSIKFRRSAVGWKVILMALETYRELSGNVEVPYSFVVPSEDPWPLETQGLPLGVRVQAIRSLKQHIKGRGGVDRMKVLNELGFVWEVSEQRWEEVLDCLRQFKDLYGHLMVPQDFVVPPLSPWEETFWGLKLGHRVNSIRCGAYVEERADRRKQLDEIGFEWDTRDIQWRLTLTCLELFLNLHPPKREEIGLKIPRNFVVPNSEPWPELAWGLPLGQRVSKIRLRGDFVREEPERIKELERLNFNWGRGKSFKDGRRYVTGYEDIDW